MFAHAARGAGHAGMAMAGIRYGPGEFFFWTHFRLRLFADYGVKGQIGAFNPLLTALNTRAPARTSTSTMKTTQNGYMLLFHAVLDCVK